MKAAARKFKTIEVDGKQRYYEPAPKGISAANFKKVVESRRSVRKFTDKPIEGSARRMPGPGLACAVFFRFAALGVLRGKNASQKSQIGNGLFGPVGCKNRTGTDCVRGAC